jgi:hypothetical protein
MSGEQVDHEELVPANTVNNHKNIKKMKEAEDQILEKCYIFSGLISLSFGSNIFQ